VDLQNRKIPVVIGREKIALMAKSKAIFSSSNIRNPFPENIQIENFNPAQKLS
jgi:hypothetical protein